MEQTEDKLFLELKKWMGEEVLVITEAVQLELIRSSISTHFRWNDFRSASRAYNAVARHY